MVAAALAYTVNVAVKTQAAVQFPGIKTKPVLTLNTTMIFKKKHLLTQKILLFLIITITITILNVLVTIVLPEVMKTTDENLPLLAGVIPALLPPAATAAARR